MSGVDAQKEQLLSSLPSVDEVLKSPPGATWLSMFRRPLVLQAVREVLSRNRKLILEGSVPDLSAETLAEACASEIMRLAAYRLTPVINATGIVIHTNLGRAILSEKVLRHVTEVATQYSNLEYDLDAGKRGKRHSHTAELLRQTTGAEDAFAVNNNAAAVLLCLNTLARGKEVIVSRGELVEIGGSFRVPDVMTSSGAFLKEVGTTNKTHYRDYEGAVSDNTALILKVHQSNYRIAGFSEDVAIRDLVSLGRQRGLPVMFDLGSGCLLDLRPHGIFDEPSVQEIIRSGVDVVTFSGDKLLGGPQGGIIAGKRHLIEQLKKNPLARALRVDKMTIAALEATLQEYLDPVLAIDAVPVLTMLLQPLPKIKARARRIVASLRRRHIRAEISLDEDSSMAGGGSLPEVKLATAVVSVRSDSISANDADGRLRRGHPPLIARIRQDALIIDARTISDREIKTAVDLLVKAYST